MIKKLLLLCLAATFSGLFSYANPVDPTTAHKVATAFMKKAGIDTKGSNVIDITKSTDFNDIYIFSILNNNGFIIISADDNSSPILAYSDNNPFIITGMPDHIHAWIEGYGRMVRHNSSASYSKSADEEWQELLNNDGKSYPTKANVQPMLQTQWGQSPYYNELCPDDPSNGGRAVSGCTATATAQIMKYFSHPTIGYGSCSFVHDRLGELSADYGNTTYLFDSMPSSIDENSSAVEINSVATLIYHVGVAVHMNYSFLGSGGKTASYGYGGEASSENALKYNFKYSPYIWTAFRTDYNIDEWTELMKNELFNGRPILYAGYDSIQSGHAFVIDGWQGNVKKFHFNWGWKGGADGWYMLYDLHPNGTSYHFDDFATATIGIEPFDGFDPSSTTRVTTTAVDANGNATTHGVVTGAGTYNFGDTLTLTATATDEAYRFVRWNDGCRYNPRSTVATGGSLELSAIFAPLKADTIRFYTSGNAMNRASNIPNGLGEDSIWGIRIPAKAITAGSSLKALKIMGRKSGNHDITILTGNDNPSETVYSSSFRSNINYPYCWYTYTLDNPVTLDGTQSLWIVLKCTDVDTPGVFSIYGGNANGMLSGESLTPMSDNWKFSWMIDALFEDNVGINDNLLSALNFQLYPNPTSNNLSISNIPNNASIEIIDLNGHKIYTTQSVGSEMTISDAKLSPGIYLVRVTSDKGIGTQRLVVK